MLLVLISRGKRKPAQFHAGIQSCGSDCARRAACRGLVMLLHVLMDQDEFKLFREVKLFIFFEDKFLPVGAVCSNLFFPPPYRDRNYPPAWFRQSVRIARLSAAVTTSKFAHSLAAAPCASQGFHTDHPSCVHISVAAAAYCGPVFSRRFLSRLQPCAESALSKAECRSLPLWHSISCCRSRKVTIIPALP